VLFLQNLTVQDVDSVFWLLVHKLPLFAIPIYLIFVLCGKGRLQTSLYFSISFPGLLIFIDLVWALLSRLPFLVIVIAFAYDPGTWIFPTVCLTQALKMIRADQREISWRSIVVGTLLFALYFWNSLFVEFGRM
jgi:hypothetical protein